MATLKHVLFIQFCIMSTVIGRTFIVNTDMTTLSDTIDLANDGATILFNADTIAIENGISIQEKKLVLMGNPANGQKTMIQDSIFMSNSEIYMQDLSIEGKKGNNGAYVMVPIPGPGCPADLTPPTDGSTAIEITGGSLALTNCTVKGGDGGYYSICRTCEGAMCFNETMSAHGKGGIGLVGKDVAVTAVSSEIQGGKEEDGERTTAIQGTNSCDICTLDVVVGEISVDGTSNIRSCDVSIASERLKGRFSNPSNFGKILSCRDMKAALNVESTQLSSIEIFVYSPKGRQVARYNVPIDNYGTKLSDIGKTCLPAGVYVYSVHNKGLPTDKNGPPR